LGGNNLEFISEDIGNLTNLIVLKLHENKLTVLPESIGNLKNLNRLFINSNQLTKLPKSIGNLTNIPEYYDEYVFFEYDGAYVHEFNGLLMHENPFTSLPDSIAKVMHAIDLDSKYQYKSLIEDVYERIAQRVQRRLVILLAKAPIIRTTTEITRDASGNILTTVQTLRSGSPKYEVLQTPKLAKRIAEYIDYK